MTGTATTSAPTNGSPTGELSGELSDLLETLEQRRWFLIHTVQGLTDSQARLRPTASELSLGGLLKHVTATERTWTDFVLIGPAAFPEPDEALWAQRQLEFTMAPEETLEGLLGAYASVARRTAEVVGGLPDLDVSHPLPVAPWFPPGARWSARRVLVHLIGETAQHAGHADVLRETIDGQKSMG